MSRIVNFGIVGCGVIGNTHAESIRAIPEDAALVAVCDIIPERAQGYAEKYNVPATYASVEEMLQHPGLDAVCVCVPSGLHAEIALAAVAQGKSALIEKPMDITREKMDALVAASQQDGVKIGCIFQRRTWDVVNKIRDAVQGGKLGRMILGDAKMKWYRSQEYYDSGDWRGTYALDGGGALMNQGIHGVDLLYYVMGPIQSVKAYQGTLTHTIEVEDNLTAVVKYASGAIGTLVVSTSCVPGDTMRHEFNGSKGSIAIEEGDIVRWHIEGEEEERIEEGTAAPAGGASADPTNIYIDGHIRLLQDMAHAIRDDRPPLITPSEGRHAVDLILAMYESARTGKEVTLC